MSKPILEGFADVVFGSRFSGGNPHRILFFWHSIGNKMLTFFSNMFTNLNLTDMETCYKLFRSDIIKQIKLITLRRLSTVWNSPINITLGGNCGVQGSFHITILAMKLIHCQNCDIFV